MTREHDVRAAGEPADVETKAQAVAMERGADEAFGRGVMAANGGHDAGAGGGGSTQALALEGAGMPDQSAVRGFRNGEANTPSATLGLPSHGRERKRSHPPDWQYAVDRTQARSRNVTYTQIAPRRYAAFPFHRSLRRDRWLPHRTIGDRRAMCVHQRVGQVLASHIQGMVW